MFNSNSPLTGGRNTHTHTARDGRLGAMDGLAMDGLAMDGYGSAIKRWMARRSLDGLVTMDDGSQWTAWR